MLVKLRIDGTNPLLSNEICCGPDLKKKNDGKQSMLGSFPLLFLMGVLINE